MGWSFTADSDNQLGVKTNLDNAATEFDTEVGTVYSQIGSLSAYWEGSDYTTFVANAELFKPALTDLGNTMRAFAYHFDSMSTGTGNLANECASIIKDLFGTGGAGSGQQGAGAGQTQTGDQTQTGGDQTQTGGDQTQTGGDQTQTGGDQTQTGGDQTQTGGDETQTGGDETQTGGDETQTGGDETQTGDGGEGEEEQPVDNRPQYSSGDAVKINGEDYHVYGYVTGSDGRSVAIYEASDGKLYTVAPNGTRSVVMMKEQIEHMDAPVREYTSEATGQDAGRTTGPYGGFVVGTSLIVNGVEYKLGEVAGTGYSDEGVAGNPAGSHTSYRGIDAGRTVSETTYTGMSSSNNGDTVSLASHNGSSNVLAVPGNTRAVQDAVRNQQPIKIQAGHSLKIDTGWFGSSRTVGDENSDVYLVYHDGKYYVADENGNVTSYSNPIDPNNILNGSGVGNDTEYK